MYLTWNIVNLIVLASVQLAVRTSRLILTRLKGIPFSSFGRALALQTKGPEFKSRQVQIKKKYHIFFFDKYCTNAFASHL